MAEEFDVQLTPSLYAGGYNISCHGANTGSINLFISGGTAPYTYVWLDGPTVRNRSNLTAGYYRVVVTSANALSVTREITLTQPDIFQVLLHPTQYEGGYNLSENGGNNGIIEVEITGGVPPYTCLWSNGSTSSDRISELVAGTYSLTVHDATNCTSSASVTLIEPTVLHLVSITSPLVVSSYNIGCGFPGSINVNVAGGTPPYQYEWEHGPSTQNVTDLTEPGDYGVLIRDENGAEVRTSIQLSRSPGISATATAFVYPNNKNTSCNTCTNGSISTTITSGTAPYTFIWNNGASVQNPNNLGAGIYSVAITDAAGCTTEKTAILTAPEREDWTMNGNTGTNPATQYIGTSDNKDLVFKRMNVETMRFDTSGTSFEKLLTAKGGIALNAAQTFKISYDNTGTETTVSYGSKSPVILPCSQVPVYGTTNEFHGSLKTWTDVNGGANKSSLTIGSAPWNGSGMIELNGTNENGNPNVLTVNYFCGRDVAICTNNAAGGFVSTGRHFQVGGPWPLNDPLIAANIRGTSQTGLRVQTLQDPLGGLVPEFNTQLSVYEKETKIIAGLLQNAGNDKEIFSVLGDGETKIGNPNKPSFYVSPSIDPVTNSYIPGNVKISSLGNLNSEFNLIQADGNGELSKVNAGTLLNSTHYWESNNSGTDVFHSTGNVGIGNTNSSPTSLLDVRGVATNGINTYLQVNQDGENFLSYKRQTGMGIKDLLTFKGDGELRVGFGEGNNTNASTFIITPSLHDQVFQLGNVGVNNSNPKAQLQVGSGIESISMGGFYSYGINNVWSTNYIGFNAARQKNYTTGVGLWHFSNNSSNAGSVIAGDLEGNLLFINIANDFSGIDKTMSDEDLLKNPVTNKSNIKMIIRSDGKVGIGTSPTAYFDPLGGYNLYVTGGIRTEKVKVDIAGANGWADYVFDESYKKMELSELENYITKNKHLPDMPSECEAKENGVDLLEMQVKLLKSVEELTLYVIDLKRENMVLRTEIEKLK